MNTELLETSFTRRLAMIIATAFCTACGSGGSNPEAIATTGSSILAGAIVNPPTGLLASGGAGLVINTTGDCAAAGETVSVALNSRDADIGIEPESDSAQVGRNVTAFTEFSLDNDSLSSEVTVISHTDLQFDFTIPSPDIISLTANFGSNSVTDFIAAWPADAPDSAVLVAERENGVCLYSMRLPGFCGTTRTANASVQLSFDDNLLDVVGCTINQAPDLPLLRL